MSGVAAVDRPSQPGLAGRRLGRYEVLTQLASGGMGGVYVARAVGVAGFERMVAVKVLHPHLAHEEEFISMFLDEARLAARIRHPNVVATVDIDDTQGDGFYLVMDYIEGDHLGALLRESAKLRERLPVPVVVRILLDALAGLTAAHELTDENGEPLHLVHRDISPHNILVGSDGSARLTDFGVAKAEVRLSSTREGQFKGKLSYMAPEHASTGEADQTSDLFSMGIILWECLAGRRLFRGENNAATLTKILSQPIPKLAGINASLAPYDVLLETALARPMTGRFQTAEDFARALEEASRASSGIGTAREVAEVVRNYAEAKLEAEKQRIKAAIDDLGRSGVRTDAPLPLPGDGSGSRSYRSHRAADLEEATVGARPSSVLPPPRKTSRLLLLAVLILGVGVGAVVLALSRGGDGDATTPPASPAQQAEVLEPTGREETGSGVGAAAPSGDPGSGDPAGNAPEAADPSGEAAAGSSAMERTAAERAQRWRARKLRQQRGQPAPEAGMTPAGMVGPEDDLLDNPYLH